MSTGIKVAKELEMKNYKKVCALLVLFFARSLVITVAEEVTGTIIFPLQYLSSGYIVHLSTGDDGIVDRTFGINYRSGLDVLDILPKYLDVGWKVVFEDKDLKPFEDFGVSRIYEIISPEGNHIVMSRLFSLDTIQHRFPYLYDKLARER